MVREWSRGEKGEAAMMPHGTAPKQPFLQRHTHT